MRRLLLGLLCVSCSAPGGPPLEIPAYRADDPVVSRAGFVNQVRLAEVQRRDTTFILMAFAVGDTLTLGAMTQGPFAGEAVWQIGDHGFRVTFPRAGEVAGLHDLAAPPAAARPEPQAAGFRDFRWVNVEVERELWMPDAGTALSLEFRPAGGPPLVMPDDGWEYAARLVERPPSP